MGHYVGCQETQVDIVPPHNVGLSQHQKRMKENRTMAEEEISYLPCLSLPTLHGKVLHLFTCSLKKYVPSSLFWVIKTLQ